MYAGMTLKQSTDMSQALKLFLWEKSLLSQCRIQSGCSVTLGQNKSVSACLIGLIGINIHLCEVKISHHVSYRERTARMSRLGVEHAFDYAETYLGGSYLKLFFKCSVHKKTSKLSDCFGL